MHPILSPMHSKDVMFSRLKTTLYIGPRNTFTAGAYEVMPVCASVLRHLTGEGCSVLLLADNSKRSNQKADPH